MYRYSIVHTNNCFDIFTGCINIEQFVGTEGIRYGIFESTKMIINLNNKILNI